MEDPRTLPVGTPIRPCPRCSKDMVVTELEAHGRIHLSCSCGEMLSSYAATDKPEKVVVWFGDYRQVFTIEKCWFHHGITSISGEKVPEKVFVPHVTKGVKKVETRTDTDLQIEARHQKIASIQYPVMDALATMEVAAQVASPTSLDLPHGRVLVAVDVRKPSKELKKALPQFDWKPIDAAKTVWQKKFSGGIHSANWYAMTLGSIHGIPCFLTYHPQ